ncbi:Nodulation protein L, putative, partial [Perkinsus marinus ATCC 50983]
LLRACGDKVDIEPPFRCDFGFNISIGDSFSAGPKLVILDASTVEIGNDVHFGHDVHLYAVDHPRSASARGTWALSGSPIRIGNNVSIGTGTIVMSGLSIGDDCIIQPGSVVTR